MALISTKAGKKLKPHTGYSISPAGRGQGNLQKREMAPPSVPQMERKMRTPEANERKGASASNTIGTAGGAWSGADTGRTRVPGTAEREARTVEANERKGTPASNTIGTAGGTWSGVSAGRTRVPGTAERAARTREANERKGASALNTAAPSPKLPTATTSRGRVTLDPQRGYSSGQDKYAWGRSASSRPATPEPTVDYRKMVELNRMEREMARALEQGRVDPSTRDYSKLPSSQLEILRGQAQVDLDTDALNQINQVLKSRRAARGQQTFGDRVSDTLSGSLSSYGAGVVNAVGTVVNAFEDPERYRREIARMQRQLEDGGYSDGVRFHRLTEGQRKNMLELIRQYADKAWQLERSTSFVNRTYQLADQMREDSAASIASAKEGLGYGGQLAVDVGVAGTQMGLDAGAALLTGGSSLVPMAVRSFGGGAQEARLAGAGLDQQLLYGVGSAALSVGTEKISNIAKPFQKMFGQGAAETIAGALVKRFGENGAIQLMQRLSQTAAGRIALSAIGEGGEELVEAVLQPFLKRATYDPNARFDGAEAWNSALVGGILGGLGGSVDVAGSWASGRGRGQAEAAGGNLTEYGGLYNEAGIWEAAADGGAVLPDAGREWHGGMGAGEQAGGVGGGTGLAQKAVDPRAAAIERHALGTALQGQRVSSRSLGISSGTDAASVTVLPEAVWDEGLRSIAERTARETGKTTTFVLGGIPVTGADGRVRPVRGVRTGSGLIIQADNYHVTAEQIADHERFHDRTAGPGTVRAMEEWIAGTMGREELDRVVDRYMEALEGVYDTEAMTEEALERAYQNVLEEVLADAYAGINAFSAHAEQFQGTVGQFLEDPGLGPWGRETGQATDWTTGPPQYSFAERVIPTYEELIQKPDIRVVDIRGERTGRIAGQRKSFLNGEYAKELYAVPVVNRDTGELLFITPKTITHTFFNLGWEQIALAEHLPEIIQEAVLTHWEPSRRAPRDMSTGVYTLFGAVRTDTGIQPVKLKVKEYYIVGQQLPQSIQEYLGPDTQEKTYASLYDGKVLILEDIEDIEKEEASSSAPSATPQWDATEKHPSASSLEEASSSVLSATPQKDEAGKYPSASSTISIKELLELVKGDAEKYVPKPQGQPYSVDGWAVAAALEAALWRIYQTAQKDPLPEDDDDSLQMLRDPFLEGFLEDGDVPIVRKKGTKPRRRRGRWRRIV